MKRLLIALGCLTVPVSRFPFPGLSAQKRAITIDDYLALKSVGNPQLSPDGKWVAYTVTEQSLKDNRGITRIWLADVASGAVRQLTAGPGSDRQPRWAPHGRTLAFVCAAGHGGQRWVPPVGGGRAGRGPWRTDHRDRRWRRRERLARRDGDRARHARRFDGRRQHERGCLSDGAGRVRDAGADDGPGSRQHAALFARRQVARVPLDGAGRVRGRSTTVDAGWTLGRSDRRPERRSDQGLDAVRRVIHLVPRFEVRLRRGGGARPRQHLPY